MIIGLHIKPNRINSIKSLNISINETIILIDHVDSRINHQTAQQNK